MVMDGTPNVVKGCEVCTLKGRAGRRSNFGGNFLPYFSARLLARFSKIISFAVLKLSPEVISIKV